MSRQQDVHRDPGSWEGPAWPAPPDQFGFGASGPEGAGGVGALWGMPGIPGMVPIPPGWPGCGCINAMLRQHEQPPAAD